MPLPMVHLAIAVRLPAGQDGFPSPAFLLGSIAPDAIHMRPGAGVEDKWRTHLRRSAAAPEVGDIQALFEQYQAAPASLRDFAAGYAAHLLADRVWLNSVVSAFRAQLPADIEMAEYRALYYQDVDQIDFNLYYQAPWQKEVWARLEQAQAPDFEPLLSATEISRWRDRTVNWFGGLMEEPGVEPQYITEAEVHWFIERAAEQIGAFFGEAEAEAEAKK